MGHHRRESSHYEPHHEDPHHDPHYRPPHHEDPHHRPPHHGEHHSKCFIATAVHGENSIEVLTLRAFRDDVLSTGPLGRALIASYVRLSPPLAAAIAQSPSLQSLAKRLIVTPAYRLARRHSDSVACKREGDSDSGTAT